MDKSICDLNSELVCMLLISVKHFHLTQYGWIMSYMKPSSCYYTAQNYDNLMCTLHLFFLHLQRKLMQPVLHWQWINEKESLDMASWVINTGTNFSSSIFHPSIKGSSSCALIHIHVLWWVRLVCSFKAFPVGGSASGLLDLPYKRYLALLIELACGTLYIWHRNLSTEA